MNGYGGAVRTDHTHVILNVTPDSFSDGGSYTSVEAALERARELDEAGADLIDIGGESTRPSAEPVSIDEELERVIPVVERISEDSEIDALLSVDTYKPVVVEAALDAGVDLINDQNGLNNPDMRDLVAAQGCKAILMDAVNIPVNPSYSSDVEDVVAAVCDRLTERVERARAAGVTSDQIILDPGIGFTTEGEEDLVLIAHTEV